jgi:SAM-dependent methyltransferase
MSSESGWQESAGAWIEEQGKEGDFGRKYILDPVMVPRALARGPRTALDVGCGEGRFCRLLRKHGVAATGIDPTAELLAHARKKDPGGEYREAYAEELPFGDNSFDLVVSYLTLIDIPDFRAAIREMARVLRPGGTLLIANLTSFSTAVEEGGWVRGENGELRHYPIDHYLEERWAWMAYRGIRVRNYHRPMRDYMNGLLGAGLRMTYFDEPEAIATAATVKSAKYRRVPYFLVMEWEKAAE